MCLTLWMPYLTGRWNQNSANDLEPFQHQAVTANNDDSSSIGPTNICGIWIKIYIIKKSSKKRHLNISSNIGHFIWAPMFKEVVKFPSPQSAAFFHHNMVLVCGSYWCISMAKRKAAVTPWPTQRHWHQAICSLHAREQSIPGGFIVIGTLQWGMSHTLAGSIARYPATKASPYFATHLEIEVT